MATFDLPDLTARLRLDTTDLDAGVERAARAGSRLGSAVGSAAGTLGAGLLTSGLAGLQTFASGAVDAFAAVEDATAAAGETFGPSVDKVVEFSKTAGDAFGLSQRQAVEASLSFGTLGRVAGLEGDNLAAFGTDLAGLAGDLASFRGTTAEEAIEAVGSALRGEAEPIRKYGILLDDATLRQEALSLGLIKSVKESLTPAQKVLAAQAAITKQASVAQGDFARTSDSTANTQKRLAVATENAQVALGEKLAPTLTALRTVFLGVVLGAGSLFDVINKIVGFIDDNLPVFAGLGTVLGIITARLVAQRVATLAVTGATKAYAAVQRVLNVVLRANPIGIILTVLAALAVALVTAYRRSETFRNVVNNAFKSVASFVLGRVEDLLNIIRKFASVSDKVFGTDFVENVDAALGQIARLQGKVATAGMEVAVGERGATASAPPRRGAGSVGPGSAGRREVNVTVNARTTATAGEVASATRFGLQTAVLVP